MLLKLDLKFFFDVFNGSNFNVNAFYTFQHDVNRKSEVFLFNRSQDADHNYSGKRLMHIFIFKCKQASFPMES